MLEADQFYIREPHYKGAEVFGLHKQKPDMPVGADDKTLKHDSLNFSCPRIGERVTKARATTMLTILEEPLPLSCKVLVHSDAGVDIWHITTV